MSEETKPNAGELVYRISSLEKELQNLNEKAEQKTKEKDQVSREFRELIKGSTLEEKLGKDLDLEQIFEMKDEKERELRSVVCQFLDIASKLRLAGAADLKSSGEYTVLRISKDWLTEDCWEKLAQILGLPMPFNIDGVIFSEGEIRVKGLDRMKAQKYIVAAVKTLNIVSGFLIRRKETVDLVKSVIERLSGRSDRNNVFSELCNQNRACTNKELSNLADLPSDKVKYLLQSLRRVETGFWEVPLIVPVDRGKHELTVFGRLICREMGILGGNLTEQKDKKDTTLDPFIKLRGGKINE